MYALRQSIAACGLLASIAGLPAAAQVPELPKLPELREVADELPSEDEILRRRGELEPRIAALRQLSPAAATDTLAKLEQIDRLLSLQLGELRRAAELEGEAVEGPAHNAGLTARLDHPPPFSVEELDAILDELEAARAGKEVLERQIAARLRTLEAAEEQLDDKSRRLRSLRQQAPLLPADGSDPLRALELEERLAQEQLRLRRLQLPNDRRELEIQTTLAEELARRAAAIRAAVQPDPAELEAKLAELAGRRETFARELDDARELTLAAETAWSAAHDQLELAEAGDPIAAARAETRRLELDVAQAREELLLTRNEQLRLLETYWSRRFELLAGKLSGAEVAELEARLSDALGDLEREQRLLDTRLEERRLALRLVEDRQDELAKEAMGPWLARQGEALAQVVADYEAQERDLDRAARLTRRMLVETRDHSLIALDERLGQLWRALVGIWRYEITTADDRPISVGKVILAILLMVLGYLASKAVSYRLGHSVFPRLGLASGAAAAFQTLIFYLLLVAFILWSLHLVSIPLTVFTVLGGVVAIGVGFGSQNVVNNFISGLIILAERPIKVGDLIEVDGVSGQVERIGPRSSRVRSGDNTHIIVPNSVFLENNVLNWTVSDDVLRTYVDVGVAYGSPVKKVAELLERVVEEEPTALAQPEPEVLFMEFGDNALGFRAYFWIRVFRSLDRFRAQSRLRFRIDALFHEAGIVIAFPQRDVHLDSLAPLDVRLVRGADGAAEIPDRLDVG